jgi:hypothetical protein
VVWRGWAEGSVDGVIDNQQWLEQRREDGRISCSLPAERQAETGCS